MSRALFIPQPGRLVSDGARTLLAPAPEEGIFWALEFLSPLYEIFSTNSAAVCSPLLGDRYDAGRSRLSIAPRQG